MKVYLFCLFIFMSFLNVKADTSNNIFVVEDETLPIANSRFDDELEPPKDVFSSTLKNDTMEKFERGELLNTSYADLKNNKKSKVALYKKIKKREIASVKNKELKNKELKAKESKEKIPSKYKRQPQSQVGKKKIIKKLPKKKK